MTEDTKIADLTVAQFRALMQECMDADRKELQRREMAGRQALWAYGRGDYARAYSVTQGFPFPSQPEAQGLYMPRKEALLGQRQESNTEARERLDNG